MQHGPMHGYSEPIDAGLEVQRTIKTSLNDSLLDGLQWVVRTSYKSHRQHGHLEWVATWREEVYLWKNAKKLGKYTMKTPCVM